MKTKNITKLFDIVRCNSGSLESYSKGNTPFVSSTNLNNGVEKFVEVVSEKELIKNVPCIAMNGFGYCTVQTRVFIGAGNNGAYVKALIPKMPMKLIELAWYAAQLNLQTWRFSYGRLAIKERVQKIDLIEFNLKNKDIEQFKEIFEKKFKKLTSIFR